MSNKYDVLRFNSRTHTTQNVVLHMLRFEMKSNQNKQHGDKGW